MSQRCVVFCLDADANAAQGSRLLALWAMESAVVANRCGLCRLAAHRHCPEAAHCPHRGCRAPGAEARAWFCLSMLDVVGCRSALCGILSPSTADVVSHSSRPRFRELRQPLWRSKHRIAVDLKQPAGAFALVSPSPRHRAVIPLD